MPVLSAPKIQQISQAIDPKQGIIEAAGDLSDVDVFSDLVLIGTYIRSEKKGSLILPKEYLEEDEHQSKTGLVLKVGPLAYGDWEDDDVRGKNATIHTWVAFAIKDTWPCQVNGAPCRFVPYEKLRARLKNPAMIF